jgi:hypothetical protein
VWAYAFFIKAYINQTITLSWRDTCDLFSHHLILDQKMKKIVRLLIVSTFILTAVPANAGLIKSGTFGGSVYDVYAYDIGADKSWGAANIFALGQGCYLATLTTAAEDSYVTSLVQMANLREVWAGGQQLDPTSAPAEGWTWVNGEGAFSYTNWSPGEPNDWRGISEQYLGINWGDGQWNDERALGNIKGFVVESAVPEPSIIALFGLGLLGLGFARRRKA